MTSPSAALQPTDQRREPAQDDNVLVAANDLIGLLHIVRFGRAVYMRLVLAVAMIVASSVSVMVAARMLGALVESLTSPAAAASAVMRFGAWFLVCESISVLTQYFGRVNLARVTIDISYGIRCELFGKMTRLPISYFDVQPLGRTITRLTNDVEGIENFFSGTLARLLLAMINIVSVTVAMIAIDVQFGLLVAALSLPALVFTVAMRKPVRYWLRTHKKRSAHINARLAEFLSGINVIRIFGLENWSRRIFVEAAESQYDSGIRTMNWNSFIRPTALLLCSLPTLVILWQGGERVIAGAMQLGILVAFIRLSERFSGPIRAISQEIQNIQEALVSSERVRKMLLETEENDTLGPDGTKVPAISGHVEYADVWMEYLPGQPVLKGISFQATPGMKVALVGATGSGKSSTINLLPVLYPILKGDIRIDGISVRDIARDHLRSQLGFVSQDVVVFTGTMRENLAAAAGRGVLSDADIMAAAAKTGLDRTIRRLPDGLDHQVIEGGENLSMGERQLVAFTRMLLKNPRILILDEATANIDEICEELIRKATHEVMEGRTCFVIAHRLSTIIDCDLILVFRDGRIVERGGHRELMAQKGYYADLATMQLQAAYVGKF